MVRKIIQLRKTNLKQGSDNITIKTGNNQQLTQLINDIIFSTVCLGTYILHPTRSSVLREELDIQRINVQQEKRTQNKE